MRSKKFLPCLILLVSPIICVPTFLSSCSNSGIVIANFESYMSDEVMDGLKQDEDINSPLKFLYYATNEDIETKFKRYYDIAVPTTYEVISLLMKNQLERIDWTKFNLNQIDGNDEITESPITNGEEAESLFTPTAKVILGLSTTYMNTESNWPGGVFPEWFSSSSYHNILDYAIPYFLQDWSFAYKSTMIPGLESEDITWDDVLNVVAPHGNEDKYDHFFDPNKTRKIGMVEDSRTIFDFAKLISTESSEPNINPTTEQTIEDYKDTYGYLTSKFDKQYFWLNSDSGQISIALATPLDDGGLNSAFAYNGDILYSAMGSDLNAGIDDPEDPAYVQYFDDRDDDDSVLHMHFIRPRYMPTMLDMVVINKNSAMNEEKKDDLYQIVKKVCLDSANEEDNDNFENDMSFQNFLYVLYTDPLICTDRYIKEQYFTEENFANWQLLRNIYSMNTGDNASLIENPISDMAKSNMYWAFINEREKL